MKKLKYIEVDEYVCETVSCNYRIEKDELSIKRKFNIVVLNSSLSHEEKENELKSYKGHIGCVINKFNFKSERQFIYYIKKSFYDYKRIKFNHCYQFYTSEFTKKQ